MNKDVIYIDVDDDVTAIIGKIKKAKESYRLSPEEIEHLHAKPALEKNGLEANVKKKETEHVN